MKKFRNLLLGAFLGGLGMYFFTAKDPAMAETVTTNDESLTERFRNNYNLMVRWMNIRQDNTNLGDRLMKKGYKTIAIYGMGEIGTLLYNELKQSDIKVLYGIDNGGAYADITVKSTDEPLEPVDAVIVSVIYAFDSIKNELADKVSAPIISLEEVLS